MKMGTKSLLFGAHAFWLHPWFVAWGWWKLYGFPWDPRLWVAFVVHDWGYWGSPNMDGEEGEHHPEWGAHLMLCWFGIKWWEFTLFHSHYYADRHHRNVSPLCAADKVALMLIPWWLYVPMVRATGEIREYKSVKKHIEEYGYQPRAHTYEDDKRWFLHIQQGVKRKWYAARA